MKVLFSGIALIALSSSTFSTIAATPDINWNYASIGYAKANIKNIGDQTIQPDGYQLNASYLLSEALYVAATFTDLSGDINLDDISGLTLDKSEFSLRLGLRKAATENIDAFFEGGYARTEVGVAGFEKVNSNGFQAGAGFRYRAAPQLELGAAVLYNDASNSDSRTFGELSARVALTDMFDLYASYQFDSEESLLATGAVYKF